MRHLSTLGDAALLGPASVLLFGLMLAMRRRDFAATFALALALCFGATVAVKFLFRACGGDITVLDVVSPSGHASSATLVYGVVALGVATGRPLATKIAIGAAAAALVAAIAISRVVTGTHSADEVVFGLALGGACLTVFAILHARIGRPRLPILPLALLPIAGSAALVLFGGHLSAEPWIKAAVRRTTDTFDVCRDTASRNETVRSGRD